MRLHEVMIDVDLIKPQKAQDNAHFLPHGAMSRLILQALREADGETLCTTEVALFVAMEGKLEIAPEDFMTFKIVIRRRMRALDSSVLMVEPGATILRIDALTSSAVSAFKIVTYV